jgi:PAS domain S-box-containing protein
VTQLEHVYALLLIVLEMTFVFVGLGLLHSQRRMLGSASFYLSLGLLFMFSQLVCASDLRAALFEGMDFQIGSTVLFLPYLAALLLVYITEGTLAAQRLIIGSLVLFGLYIYLGEITRLQCSWFGFSISSGISAEAFDGLLDESRRSMVAMVSAHLLDLFMLPIIFTRLKNANCRLFFCVLGALAFTQIVDSILYVGILYWNSPDPLMLLGGSFIARSLATLWLSVLLSVYLRKIEQESEPHGRSPLDIVFAFFGGYGRSKLLEESLREWEGRYQQVLQNASEMIILLNPEGRVLDANWAAVNIMGRTLPQEMIGMKLFQWMRREDGGQLKIEVPEDLSGAEAAEVFPMRFVALIGGEAQPEKTHTVACSLSVQMMKSRPVLVLIGRDITDETRLQQEKNLLHEQLIHAQRIESLGQLAGGIAHDFNNHIHAILGHVDVINFMHTPDNPEVNRHLDKIAEIAEQAGKLTGQLLGFARKGKYQIVDIDLRELVEKSLDLLMPKSQIDLDIEFDPPNYPMMVRGDLIQLQQVLLNLMINAIDAMARNAGRKLLQIEVVEGDKSGTKPGKPAELKDVPVSGFYCIKVKDNGAGMDSAIKSKVFEPFFTTKPVGQGTGMGLAMVYGTVTSHQGWVQLTSSPGKGAAFYVFLPKAER